MAGTTDNFLSWDSSMLYILAHILAYSFWFQVSGQPLPGWVSTMATYVQLAASACNPFIYGIFRREFRVAFRKQYGRLLAKLGLTQRRFEPQHRSTGLHSVTTLRPLAFVRDSTSPLAGDKLNSNSSSSDLSTE